MSTCDSRGDETNALGTSITGETHRCTSLRVGYHDDADGNGQAQTNEQRFWFSKSKYQKSRRAALLGSYPTLRLRVPFLRTIGIGVALGSRRNRPPTQLDSPSLNDDSSLTPRDRRGPHADDTGGVLSALLLSLDLPKSVFCILRSFSTAGDDAPFRCVVTSAIVFSPNAEAQRAVLSNTSVPEYNCRPRAGSQPRSERAVEAPTEGANRLLSRGSPFLGLRPRSTGNVGDIGAKLPITRGVEISSHAVPSGKHVAGGLDTLRLVLLVESELEVVAEVRERDLRGREEGRSRVVWSRESDREWRRVDVGSWLQRCTNSNSSVCDTEDASSAASQPMSQAISSTIAMVERRRTLRSRHPFSTRVAPRPMLHGISYTPGQKRVSERGHRHIVTHYAESSLST